MKTLTTSLAALCFLLLVSSCGKETAASETEIPALLSALHLGMVEKAVTGDADAQSGLGQMYYLGFGVPKDNNEAERWLLKSAHQGNAAAQYTLGMMHAAGELTPSSWNGHAPEGDVAACAWLILSGLSGYAEAHSARDQISAKMTPEQIAEAQELSKELLKQIEENRKKAK